MNPCTRAIELIVCECGAEVELEFKNNECKCGRNHENLQGRDKPNSLSVHQREGFDYKKGLMLTVTTVGGMATFALTFVGVLLYV